MMYVSPRLRRDRVRRRFPPAWCLAALMLSQAASSAEPGDDGIHGRLALGDAENFNRGDSFDALLGSADHNDSFANLRLTYDDSFGHWSVDAHYVLSFQDGEETRLSHDEASLFPSPPPTWLNLQSKLVDSGSMLGTEGIDRLSISYSTPSFVVRVGRQALTWGSGLAFRPMDLFDPFSPTATDTEFKPGTDMVYMQYLFDDGSDLQFIAVPRARTENAWPAANESSFALHYHASLAEWDVTAVFARDRGDWTGALGIGGQLSGATWNAEILPTAVHGDRVKISALANISDAETIFDRNVTLFAEYFRNGFGVEGQTSFTGLPADLRARLLRGQLFNVRRDYLAAGMALEWSPLVTVSPTAIANLDDGSLFILAAVNWSLSDDLVLVGGVEAPVGARGTEFGGLPLEPGGATVLSPPSQFYAQLRRYF